MSDGIFPPTEDFAAKAHIDRPRYDEIYARSIENPDGFWRDEAGRLDWMKAPETIRNVNYSHPEVSIRWFEDGTLNVSANCIDRHLETRGDQTAIIWEPDESGRRSAAHHLP